MEKESKCKIQIRGEGSQKDTIRNYEKELLDGPSKEDGMDEPLHVLLTADLDEQLEVGASLINAIL